MPQRPNCGAEGASSAHYIYVRGIGGCLFDDEEESDCADCAASCTYPRKVVNCFPFLIGSFGGAPPRHLQSEQPHSRCEAVRVTEGLTVNGQGSARPSNSA